MSAASSSSSSNIDLSASLVNFSALFQGQFKDILKYRGFSYLSDACSSSGSVQFWVYDWLGPDFKTCKAWCFLIRSFELNLSRDKPDLWCWDLHGGWTQQCQKFCCENPGLWQGDRVWVKDVSLSFLPQKQGWERQQSIAFAVGPRLCLVRGLAAARAPMHAGPCDSSAAHLSLSPTWQAGKVPRRTQPSQRREARFLKGRSAGRTRLQTKAVPRQGGSLCPLQW